MPAPAHEWSAAEIAGDRPPRWSPGRDVAWVLVLKAALLLALYLACFGPSHRVAATSAEIAAAFTRAEPSH